MKHRGVIYLTTAITCAASFMWQHMVQALPATETASITAVVVPVAIKDETPLEARIRSAEFRASRSRRAMDLSGFAPSLYRGQWYTPKGESHRHCIMYVESRFHYTSKSKRSSASGAYQFLDSKWRHGLVAMMKRESRSTHDGLVAEAQALIDTPISKWSRYWQDRAFYTAWQFGEGSHHWSYAHTQC